jgi:casein kinase II subunit beta
MCACACVGVGNYGESSCGEIYYPKSARKGAMDGAFVGTSFPHLLLMAYPELVPPRPAQVLQPPF